MRISIRAHIETDDSQSVEPIIVGVIERAGDGDPASGLGLFLRESRELLRQIQAVVLDRQVDEFTRTAARCLACAKPLGIKDTKSAKAERAEAKRAKTAARAAAKAAKASTEEAGP